MSEQSSPTSQTASAFYDPDSSSWRTSQGSLLSEVFPLLERLPDWATTADGALCAQATPGHLIAVRDGSASPNLPTPRSFLANVAARPLKIRDVYKCNLEEAVALLPTPRAQNGEPRNMKPWIRPLDQPQNLENAIARLLPTPTVNGAFNDGPSQWERNSLPLPIVALQFTSALTWQRSNDGNGSLDDQHPTLPIAEDCDPSLSSG